MKNSVELLGYYGGDKTHSLSAWTSTFEELNIPIPENIEDRVDVIFNYMASFKKKSSEELLKMLAEHEHHTPFEKSTLHFMVNTDIASHIHLLKHRIGVSINAESARYKELKEDKFYLPEDWVNCYCSNLKEIEEEFNIDFNENGNYRNLLATYTALGNMIYHSALKDLTPVLGRKRAKESARFFKTYNSQITSDVMFNFRSFMHFQKLRNSEHAQLEIREIAQQMLQLVKETGAFEHTLKAWGYGN
jgi:thymidylate synthase (FAD)